MSVGVYPNLELPPTPQCRPYVYINMVATIDGKILDGDRDEPVHLGSPTDRATMKQLEDAADGVIAGAQSVRATPKYNLPAHCYRYCVSKSGGVPTGSDFFTAAPDRAYIVMPMGTQSALPTLNFGYDIVDLPKLFEYIRREHGIERLLCEGGGVLNAELFAANLVDEIFLTVAPKIKLGKDVPTIAEGKPLAHDQIQNYQLMSCIQRASELFLRYRRQA